jgi:hypothetical protein
MHTAAWQADYRSLKSENTPFIGSPQKGFV